MTRNDMKRMINRVSGPIIEPPSTELEQKALREFDDRDGPAIKAIFDARRCEQYLTFVVEPIFLAFHGLSRPQMKRALDRLEGRLIKTVDIERGTRVIRLLPDWENPEALAGDPSLKIQAALSQAAAVNQDSRLGGERQCSAYPDLSLPPELLAELRRLVDPPSDP